MGRRIPPWPLYPARNSPYGVLIEGTLYWPERL